MDRAHMAHKNLTSRDGFMVHVSFSSIGIITHNIININIWIGFKQ